MDNITNKAIVVAVGIFITIAITSAIITSITQVRNIYQDVYETDISISNDFSEFDKYDGTTLTGVDLVNTINKYLNNSNVEVYEGVTLKDTKPDQSYIDSVISNRYNCSINREGQKVKVTFDQI